MITLFIIELVILILLSASTEKEQDLASAVLIFLGILAAFFLTWTNPIHWFVENINVVAVGFVGYFVVGAAWSVYKYWRWMESDTVRNEVSSLKEYWAKISSGVPLEEYVRREFSKGIIGGRSKEKISRWIVLWPASLTWALTFRLIDNAWKLVYETLKGVYSSIEKKVINRIIRS